MPPTSASTRSPPYQDDEERSEQRDELEPGGEQHETFVLHVDLDARADR
jgi:hypothetical protein